MRYLGGKAKIARRLSARIREIVGEAPIWEPFCGGLNMSEHLLPAICTDVDQPLVALIDAVIAGWDPPSFIDRAMWIEYRDLPEDNPLHGFCRYGCTFGGNYSSGFATGGHGADAATSRRSLLRACDVLRRAGTHVSRCSFFDVEPHETSLAIYCDPPYRGRTGYRHPFDHDAFDRRCVEWAHLGVTVLVSEYSMPTEIADCVWECPKAAGLRGRESVHHERLYRIKPYA